jgi:hypothetical protein
VNNDINLWLDESQLPFQQVNINKWRMRMTHQHCDYVVTLTRHADWFSYGADLIGNIQGEKAENFYEYILSLNNKLNGAHIALENDRFVLIRDDYIEDINKYNLYRSLNTFHDVHEYTYKKILDAAEEYNVKFTR